MIATIFTKNNPATEDRDCQYESKRKWKKKKKSK